MTRTLSLAAIVALTAGLRAAPPPAEPVRCGLNMSNVMLHVADDVTVSVRTLESELVGRTPGKPPVFDDPGSYTMRLRTAEMSMDAAGLTALVGRVFAGASPIKDLKLSIEEGAIKQSGKLQRGVPIPFSMKTSVSPTADGRIRLHATSLKAIGIPVKGMLDLFGLELDNLMKAPAGRGIRIEGDDILLAPTDVLPPPATEGRVKDVRVAGDRLVMTMVGAGTPPRRPATLPEPTSRNFLYFYGGTVRFGKLTMTDADLQLVDADPRDHFDFFPARYARQLVAGYSRTTERGGLKVMMPDYGDIGAPRGAVRLPQISR